MHAAHKFHHHEILSADLAKMVGLDDVGMDQIRDQSGLSDEIFLEFRDRRILLADELHRDVLAKIPSAPLNALVNQSHSPLGDLAGKLVVQLVEDVFEGCQSE